jgi:N-acetylmuramoyl-L-alanine amidase
MPVEGLPLRRGHAGPAVRDLHQRLAQAGLVVDGDEFGDATADAVKAFQESRRIEVDGVVGRQTWAALIEAAHRLGDRLLYQKSSPMLRGDDVAELQQRLGALGFDAGRVDGIFGPDTADALQKFQRNAGLPIDGIFGPDSLAALKRLGGREAQANVATVREREHLLTSGAGRGCKVVLGGLGGFGAVLDTITRRLRHGGPMVEVVSHPDESHHAQVSNHLGADLYLGLVAADERVCRASYFATEGFESAGGHQLSELLVAALDGEVFGPASAVGQRLPVLRETRMPAVVLRLGPPGVLTAQAPALAEAVTAAVLAWTAAPAAVVEETSRS